MSSEDHIDLNTSGPSGNDSEEKKLPNSENEPSESPTRPNSSEIKDDIINEDNLNLAEGEVGNEDGQQELEMEVDEELAHKSPVLQQDVVLSETVTVVENTEEANIKLNSENGCGIVQEGSNCSTETVTLVEKTEEVNISPISGVKRARMTSVSQDPSVHVMYNFLTRASKKKLEELLQQWSEWHAQDSLSTNDSDKELQCGEETFFPALHVGLEKTSTVSFWMDEETSKETNTFIALDGDSVPLYDRGYAMGLTSSDGLSNLEGGMEKLDDSRCFNCGSYSHSMRECPKPRDNAAVDNARKQHNSNRNRNSGPRNPTRYYQDSSGGKYDGLRPGILGSETRKLLGLAELDPPPWLNRMRQIGYPPGYLEPEDEDQPSGITIYADEENKEEEGAEAGGQVGGGEDGEILEKEIPEPKKKMTVEFPGINAPIPQNADQRRWTSAETSSFDSPRNRFQSMSPSSADTISRGHYTDHRRSGEYRGDGLPGCTPMVDSSMPTYAPSYGGYGPNNGSESHSPRLNPIPRSPNLGRSLSDRGRRSPLIYEGSPGHSPHNSLPHLSPDIRHSPQGSANFERWSYGTHHHNPNPEFAPQRKDRHEHDHHHRRK